MKSPPPNADEFNNLRAASTDKDGLAIDASQFP